MQGGDNDDGSIISRSKGVTDPFQYTHGSVFMMPAVNSCAAATALSAPRRVHQTGSNQSVEHGDAGLPRGGQRVLLVRCRFPCSARSPLPHSALSARNHLHIKIHVVRALQDGRVHGHLRAGGRGIHTHGRAPFRLRRAAQPPAPAGAQPASPLRSLLLRRYVPPPTAVTRSSHRRPFVAPLAHQFAAEKCGPFKGVQAEGEQPLECMSVRQQPTPHRREAPPPPPRVADRAV